MAAEHPIYLQPRVMAALQRNDTNRDAELIYGILFDRIDADEMSSYVRYIRRCVEQEISHIQRVEKDGGLLEYVRTLESRLAQAVAETRRLQAKSLTDAQQPPPPPAAAAAAVGANEMLEAFDAEDRELLHRALQATKSLEAILECFRSLDKRDLGYGGTENDRLVAKVTFFYFLNCTRALQEFAFRSTHPERPAQRTPLKPDAIRSFRPGLQLLAERYSNREIDGAAFVGQLKRLYMFGTADACTPPSRRHTNQ